jgi:hypothetical protein
LSSGKSGERFGRTTEIFSGVKPGPAHRGAPHEYGGGTGGAECDAEFGRVGHCYILHGILDRVAAGYKSSRLNRYKTSNGYLANECGPERKHEIQTFNLEPARRQIHNGGTGP